MLNVPPRLHPEPKRLLREAQIRSEELADDEAVRSGALAISLAAEDEVVEHVAFSPVTITGEPTGWIGLGPLAVRADNRRNGIGQVLIRAELDRLEKQGARGCVVLGEPTYYAHFLR